MSNLKDFALYYAQHSRYANKEQENATSTSSSSSSMDDLKKDLEDANSKLSAAEDRLETTKTRTQNATEYQQRINSRFAAVGDKGRERVGLKPLGADYTGPTDRKGLEKEIAVAKDEQETAQSELEEAKSDQYWAEAALDIANINNDTVSSNDYWNNLARSIRTLDQWEQNKGASQQRFGWIGQQRREELGLDAPELGLQDTKKISPFWWINDEEYATLMTLRKSDPEAAERYQEILNYALNERKAKEESELLSESSTFDKLRTYIGDRITTPVSLIATYGDAIRNATGEYRPVDINAPAYRPTRERAQVREELVDTIESPFGRMMAGLGLSALDYLTALPFGGPAGYLSLAASDAAEGAYDVLLRGGSAQDAALYGTLRGAISVMTERIPFNNLLKIGRGAAKNATRSMIRNILKQAGFEAGEEFVSSFAYNLADIRVNGKNSNYNLAIQNYMANGMTEEEATKQANIDFFVLEPLQSAGGGAIFGSVFGAGGSLVGNIRNRLRNNNNADITTIVNDIAAGMRQQDQRPLAPWETAREPEPWESRVPTKTANDLRTDLEQKHQREREELEALIEGSRNANPWESTQPWDAAVDDFTAQRMREDLRTRQEEEARSLEDLLGDNPTPERVATASVNGATNRLNNVSADDDTPINNGVNIPPMVNPVSDEVPTTNEAPTNNEMPATNEPQAQPSNAVTDVDNSMLGGFETPQGEGQTVPNQFAENSLQKAAEAGTVNRDIADALKGATHQRVSNEQLIQQAQDAITKNTPEAVALYLRDKVNRGNTLNSVETTAGLILLENYSRSGDRQSAVDLAETMMLASSDGARALQALKVIQTYLPDTFVTMANRMLARKNAPMLTEAEINTIYALQQLANNAKDIMAIDNPQQRQAVIDDIIANIDPNFRKDIDKIFRKARKEDIADWMILLTQKVISNKMPATATDKVRAWQRINLLLNPKTQIRNILGNALFGSTELLGNTTIAPWVDRLLSKRTGQRTATTTQFGDYLRGMVQAARDVRLATETGTIGLLGNRYDESAAYTNTQPFDNAALAALNNAVTASLTFGDKLFSGARESDIAAQLRKVNPGLSDAEIAEIARQAALEITFQNDSSLANTLMKIRDLLPNAVRGGRSDAEMSKARKAAVRAAEIISYATVPFVRTPANILGQVLNYSPAGLLRGIYKAVQVAYNGKNVSPQFQRSAVNAITRGIVGTGLSGIGVILAALGKASGESSGEDEKFREANGISDNAFKITIGDKDYWFDFSSLGPEIAAINTGASIFNELSKITDETSAFDIVMNIFSAPINDVLQDDLWSGIIDLVGYIGEGDVSRAIEETLGDMATQAVPLGSFLRMITNTIDPYSRETSGNWTLNSIISQIPGLSSNLPVRYDEYGNPIERAPGTSNGLERFLNAAFNPATVSLDLRSTPAGAEAARVYNETGESGVLPSKAPYDLQYDNKGYDVAGENRSNYAKTSGQLTTQGINSLLDSPEYLAASDEEKATMLENIIGNARDIARQDFFNTQGVEEETTASEFVSIMESEGLSSGDAMALYASFRSAGNKNADKFDVLINSDLTIDQKITAITDFSDAGETTIENATEAINRGLGRVWLELYEMAYAKDENNKSLYSKADVQAAFDELTIGLTQSEKDWLRQSTGRWKSL